MRVFFAFIPFFRTQFSIAVVQGDLTFSALWKSTYYNKNGNASVLFTRSVQRTKCTIISLVVLPLLSVLPLYTSQKYVVQLSMFYIGSPEHDEPKYDCLCPVFLNVKVQSIRVIPQLHGSALHKFSQSIFVPFSNGP